MHLIRKILFGLAVILGAIIGLVLCAAREARQHGASRMPVAPRRIPVVARPVTPQRNAPGPQSSVQKDRQEIGAPLTSLTELLHDAVNTQKALLKADLSAKPSCSRPGTPVAEATTRQTADTRSSGTK